MHTGIASVDLEVLRDLGYRFPSIDHYLDLHNLYSPDGRVLAVEVTQAEAIKKANHDLGRRHLTRDRELGL